MRTVSHSPIVITPQPLLCDFSWWTVAPPTRFTQRCQEQWARMQIDALRIEARLFVRRRPVTMSDVDGKEN